MTIIIYIILWPHVIIGKKNFYLYCSVPCHNPKKESKVVAKVVAIAFVTTFYMSQIWLQPSSTIVTRNYITNMVATIIKNCDQCERVNRTATPPPAAKITGSDHMKSHGN